MQCIHGMYSLLNELTRPLCYMIIDNNYRLCPAQDLLTVFTSGWKCVLRNLQFQNR